jgi:signal transduction histidine kinase/type II secretory pathway pseudopilin PulG
MASELDMSFELGGRRDRARRSLLRASTAVAFALFSVLALALGEVWLGWRATRLREQAVSQQQRAEQAEAKARADLWRSYVAEARAIRLGTTLERRDAALESIRRAAAIAAAPELRNEAVAALALTGWRLESSLPQDSSALKNAFDPALRRCALALPDGDIAIRDLASGRELQRLRRREGGVPEEQSHCGALEFSADGRLLSARYLGGGIAIWNLDSGRTIFRHDLGQIRGLSSPARFSRDHRFLVAPVYSPRDGMAVFETQSGRMAGFFPEFSSYRHAAVHPAAPLFAANTESNVVVVNWESRERTEFPFVSGSRKLEWTPDGRHLIIGGNSLEVEVWDFANRQRRTLGAHKGDVWFLAVAPDGLRLATCAEDGLSRIWDLRSGRLLGATAQGAIMQWGDDNRIGVELANVSLDVYQFVPSPVHQVLPGTTEAFDARTLDISPDGRWAISVVEDRGLAIWNLQNPGAPDWLPAPGVISLCFHPAEPRILLTRRGGPESCPFSVPANGGRMRLNFGPPEKLACASNSQPDLVCMSANGQATVWVQLAAGKIWVRHAGETGEPVLMRGNGHSSVVRQSGSPQGAGSTSISPDGRWLACGYSGQGAEVCDARTGRLVASLSSRHGNVQFSADGRMLLVAEKQRCLIFHTKDWSLAREIPIASYITFPPTAAFSPDGSMLVAAKTPRSAALYDTATGREVAELESPGASPIISTRWSVDGRQILFANRENELDLWRPTALRQELGALGLDWGAGPSGPKGDAAQAAAAGAVPATWIAAATFATVVLIAVIALLALRRHRSLVEDFTRTEALAAQREHELQGEREISQLKSSFVSLVSHEFRTPLGIIQSSAQILERYLEKLSPGQRREQLESINRNVLRMACMIDDILLLGRVEAGQLLFTPAPLDLPGFCRRFTDEMLSATRQRCRIRLEFRAADFPPAQADESLLRHILGNLLSNAVKYSPPGSTVEFTLARRAGDALFNIRDQGIGIPEADRANLFKAFHRGLNVSEFPGTGLGLTIVKRCLDLHGGKLSLDSKEGIGTAFLVEIPAFPAAENPAPLPLNPF